MFWLLGFIATIPLANWTLAHFGVLDIAGLAVPSGVFWVGIALTLRDLAHSDLGARWVFVGIVVGSLLSLVIAPAFALASAAAFLFSETADLLVYSPLRARGRWLLGVAASNTVGAFVDSVIFLWLAFGSLAFLPGQMLGKLAMTALALPVLWLIRDRDLGDVPEETLRSAIERDLFGPTEWTEADFEDPA